LLVFGKYCFHFGEIVHLSAAWTGTSCAKPYGFFHIGGARTALFNWLYARHMSGTFILRIEDTDHERHMEEATSVILSGMRWLGMDWDEGSEVGGKYGPYFQSQRGDSYGEYLEILRRNDKIYEQDGAIHFHVSREPQLIDDLIRGQVYRMEEKDFVIFRSNGTPVFHFVNMVNEVAMEISLVIRGEDH
jgi:glutamyl-tRNA synthetase